MKVAVVGSRTFADWHLLVNTLDDIHYYKTPITLIVSGGAIGADKMGEDYAKLHGIPTLIFKPDWEKHGKAAGMIRNKDIVTNAEMVVAFHDGESRGTANSIELAKKMGKKLKIVEF